MAATTTIRFWSAISSWIEIMSSTLVTFNFKTFQKQGSTQFLNFFAKIWEMCNWRQLLSIDYDKEMENFDYFNFYSNKSYIVCFNLNSICKILSFEVLHVEIANNYKIWNFRSFLTIFDKFSIFTNFWWFLKKRNSKKVQNELEMMSSFRKTWFWG